MKYISKYWCCKTSSKVSFILLGGNQINKGAFNWTQSRQEDKEKTEKTG